jgi:hypothetical protein
VHHHKIGETNEPAMYRITDNAVSISEGFSDVFVFHAFIQVAVLCIYYTIFSLDR